MSLGSIAPVREVFGTRLLLPWLPEWVDLNIAVPVAATAIVVAVGIIVICVAVSRRALGPTQTRLTSDCMLCLDSFVLILNFVLNFPFLIMISNGYFNHDNAYF